MTYDTNNSNSGHDSSYSFLTFSIFFLLTHWSLFFCFLFYLFTWPGIPVSFFNSAVIAGVDGLDSGSDCFPGGTWPSGFHVPFALTCPDSDPSRVLTAWAHHWGQPLRDPQDLPQRYERPDKDWSSFHPLAWHSLIPLSLTYKYAYKHVSNGWHGSWCV